MQWQVMVEFKGAEARYRVTLDENRFFQAELVSYDGTLDFDPPPQKLLLFKGIRGWIGSTKNTDFLNELGRNIDYLYTSDDFLTPDRYYVTNTRGEGSPDAYPNRE